MATTPDVTTALDGSGRRFAFRPAAITGNGSVLVTISERGEVERIFWPNVDHGQHLGELRLGLERQDETLWLDDAPCSWEQTYLEGSSVLRTTAAIGPDRSSSCGSGTPYPGGMITAAASAAKVRSAAVKRPPQR